MFLGVGIFRVRRGFFVRFIIRVEVIFIFFFIEIFFLVVIRLGFLILTFYYVERVRGKELD